MARQRNGGKIKNWSRKQRDTPAVPYHWENDINHQPLLVLKSSLGNGGYVIIYRERRLAHRDTKKAARQYAVNWARNHPYGKVGSYKQLKQ